LKFRWFRRVIKNGLFRYNDGADDDIRFLLEKKEKFLMHEIEWCRYRVINVYNCFAHNEVVVLYIAYRRTYRLLRVYNIVIVAFAVLCTSPSSSSLAS
jgi:hypothetical protein